MNTVFGVTFFLILAFTILAVAVAALGADVPFVDFLGEYWGLLGLIVVALAGVFRVLLRLKRQHPQLLVNLTGWMIVASPSAMPLIMAWVLFDVFPEELRTEMLLLAFFVVIVSVPLMPRHAIFEVLEKIKEDGDSKSTEMAKEEEPRS